jgi:molybdopterin-guanine dinucleotide biosynthesis protein A
MLSIVIQAGGESRRMGQDKALIPFLGRPLIERAMDRVGGLGAEALITTNRPEAYAYLGLALIPDRIPGRGALGGLYTALSAARYPLVGVVACDMPFASAELLAAERDLLLADETLDAVIPRPDGLTEPFHAVYRRERCLKLVAAAIQAEKWKVDSWFGEARIRFLSGDEIRIYDPLRLAFENVNTPEELAAAEKIAADDSLF